MRLKSISIVGFKTCADRVNLQFGDGITGVIGPNGSGKSNIIAAVRWVMGEQSVKSLRDPQEVIFTGSQMRKPSSMAEVSLTFYNDGKGCSPQFMHLPEITIGRRIYRDGEREYFFNKESCRLKDIVDFLLSAGLGARGYSIIEQEKRDRIIQATPAVLRDILEETAGITVFKHHRKQAERNLDSVQERLITISELGKELEKQSENLEKQVEKAQKKQELQKELKRYEIHLLCHRVGFFRKSISDINTAIGELNKEERSSASTSSEWEAELVGLREKMTELRSSIRESEEFLEDKRLARAKYIERREQMKSRWDEKRVQKEKIIESLQQEKSVLEDYETRKDACIEEIEDIEKQFLTIDGSLETLSYQLDEVEEFLSVKQRDGEEIQLEIRALEELLSTLRTRSEGILERVDKAHGKISHVQDKITEERIFVDELYEQRSLLKAELSSKSKDGYQEKNSKQSLESRLKELEELLEEKRDVRDESKGKLYEVRSHLETLRKIDKSSEGMSQGVKKLRDNINVDILGFVFEKIDGSLEDNKILEAALPKFLESALVSDFEKLLDVLDYSEEEGLGGLSFIIESWLNKSLDVPLSLIELIRNTPGLRFIGDTSHSEMKGINKFLSRVIVGKDEWMLLKAVRILKDDAHNFIFISERGVMLTDKGKVFLGGYNEDSNNIGILQRKHEITRLEKEYAEAQQSLASAEGYLFSLDTEKKKVKEELAEINEVLDKEKVETIRLTNSLDTLQLKIDMAEKNIQKMKDEVAALAEEMKEDRKIYSEHQQQSEESAEELAVYRNRLEEFEESLEEIKENRNELKLQRGNHQSEKSILSERSEQRRRAYEELSSQYLRSQERVDVFSREIAEVNDSLNTWNDNDINLDREIEVLANDINNIEQKLESLQEEEASVEEHLSVIDSRLKEEKDKDNYRQKKVNEKELEKARLSAVLETAEKDAFERFSLSPEELPNESVNNEKGFENKVEENIHELKKKIEVLGAVNEGAVEEFQNLQIRKEEFFSQKQDIELSLDKINHSILRIEDEIRNQFKSVFEEVNLRFQELFPILFPGGEGRLSLVDPDDMLTTGVEILVRLPGKRMQKMHLFSGGEKALTAISLIFALLKTHPAPFCFLDEVDAPLDEANVGRFNRVLEELSKDFQFVVITHNRRTMEVLDKIYGISMQQAGISKLVSVDLTEVPSHLRKKGRKEGSDTLVRSGASTSA